MIFDEFHERHLQADLGLALTLDAREGLRPELRVLVMSATLDAGPVAAVLGGAPVVTSQGRTYPVAVRWQPRPEGGRLVPAVAAAVTAGLERDGGDVLTFLPGVGEIRAVAAALGSATGVQATGVQATGVQATGVQATGVQVVALHGTMPAADQDRALRSGPERRVILSTDLAESSVTVEGVGVVVDAGLARRPAYDPGTGLTRLRTVVASRASAEQRAGRAGRAGPGVAYRLWSASEHAARRPWPDPEITTTDLTALALELSVWGAPAGALRWLDPPPPAALDRAVELLDALGALDGGRPTGEGRRLVGLPVHPRLARMLLAASGPDRQNAALLAALLTERDIFGRDGDDGPATADVAARLAVLHGDRGDGSGPIDRAAVATVRRRADELLRRLAAGAGADRAVVPRASRPWWPARRGLPRPHRPGAWRWPLPAPSGWRAPTLPDHDPLAATAWLVAADVEGAAGGAGRADGRIRLAAAIDRADVERVGGEAVRTVVRLSWDSHVDDLRATTERVLGALVLDTASAAPRPRS